MNKKIRKIKEIGSDNPFNVPDDYFENLTESIMSQLPERFSEEQKPITLWKRMEPWMYMAAMFAGIALMVKLFVGSPNEGASGLNLTSSTEIEEFYQFYEDQLAEAISRESLYFAADEDGNSWNGNSD